MTSRLLLTHLTYFGPNRPTASVEFSPTLTTITGPSNTGKSFIVDSIDFMLGAKQLREIPQLDGYTDVMLGMLLPSGMAITLARSVQGGRFSLYESDLRDGPLGVPDRSLAKTHSTKSTNNLSRYLLKSLDFDGRRLRRNASNQTDSLSFRNLAHLCVVDEGQIQSEVPPAMSGPFVSRTKETSLLKLLLDGDDDSGLTESMPAGERRTVAKAKNEVIDAMLLHLEIQLAESGGRDQLRHQLVRLNQAFAEAMAAIDEIGSAREVMVSERARLVKAKVEANSRGGDLGALGGRFGMLSRQYQTDVSRLEMVEEVGSVLGYFEKGDCQFCGTAHENQPSLAEEHDDQTDFANAVRAELAKTAGLAADLCATIEDIEGQRSQLAKEVAQMEKQIEFFDRELVKQQAEGWPERQELDRLIAAKLNVERDLALFAQIDDLDRIKVDASESAVSDAVTAVNSMSLSAVREFSEEIVARLSEWGFQGAGSARYDRGRQDIQAGDQYRASQGKGVRAVLHAAFTTALINYCYNRERAHPGFIVLDSPLVTYREPDGEEPLDIGIVELFYRDLANGVQGQVIVVENMPPPANMDDAHSIAFSGMPGIGREGLLPARSLRRAPVVSPAQPVA